MKKKKNEILENKLDTDELEAVNGGKKEYHPPVGVQLTFLRNIVRRQ